MIRGARKEMIVVRTGNSRYFDEAYFVLREDAQKERRKSTDILSEANRILSEIAPDFSPASKKQSKQTWDGKEGTAIMCTDLDIDFAQFFI